MKIFEDIIKTIELKCNDNVATISNVELWAKSWRAEREMLCGQLDEMIDELMIERGHHSDTVRSPIFGEERQLAKDLVEKILY